MATTTELVGRIERLEAAIAELEALVGGVRGGHAQNVVAITEFVGGFENEDQPDDKERR